MEIPRNRVTRRQLLKWMGLTAATAALAACAPAPAPAPTQAPAEATQAPAEATQAPKATAEVKPTETPIPPAPTATPLPTAAPRIYGSGKTEVVVWYQDWDGANKIMKFAAEEYIKTHADVTLNLQAIDYGNLLTKMLPSIASGTEGDVLNMYTDWVVATDIRQVFLDITDTAGGYQSWADKMWKAAFEDVDAPEGKVFYLPWLAGIRGAVLTFNTDHAKEANIDYLNLKTYEDVIDAGVKMTKKDGDKLTRAGYSPRSSQYQLLWSLIWMLGGNFYDRESGKWSHSTPEGEAAAQMIYDLYWKYGTCDYALFTDEYQAVSQQLVSIWGDGAWTMGVQTDVAKVPCDNIVLPKLANAKEYVLYPQHMAGFGLSKRLAKQEDKLKAALDFATLVVGPDALIQAFDFYSGVCMTKAVYEDPRIEKVKYGPVSKRVATTMWPVARYPRDHVADQSQAATELDRAMRKEISIKEALANMDAYLNEQEAAARERIGI